MSAYCCQMLLLTWSTLVSASAATTLLSSFQWSHAESVQSSLSSLYKLYHSYIHASTCCCSDWLAADKAKAIAEEKRRIEEEEANMLVGPELPAGVSQQDMGDYGGALLPGEFRKADIQSQGDDKY